MIFLEASEQCSPDTHAATSGSWNSVPFERSSVSVAKSSTLSPQYPSPHRSPLTGLCNTVPTVNVALSLHVWWTRPRCLTAQSAVGMLPQLSTVQLFDDGPLAPPYYFSVFKEQGSIQA